MRRLLIGYLLFGAGYIAYMTFMIAWVQRSGATALLQGVFWCAIGLSAMTSPWLWAGVLTRALHGRAFAILTAITFAGSVLPLLSDAVPVLLASAALFGSAFFAVVAATTVFVRRNLSPSAWPSAIGTLTVAFGIGQMLGPISVGFLNDWTQGLSAGLWASAGLLLAAALVGLMQHDGMDRAAGTSTGKRAAVELAARQGQLPTPPDFSAATHARSRGKLAKLVALAKAGNAEGLKAVAINPVSTSPRALARYRDHAVVAIEARKAAAAV